MTVELFRNAPMGNDVESLWTPALLRKTAFGSVDSVVRGTQIFWEGASGTLDGTIEIWGTNDFRARSLVARFDVSETSNLDSAILAEMPGTFEFFKARYASNQITGGYLSAVAYYEPI